MAGEAFIVVSVSVKTVDSGRHDPERELFLTSKNPSETVGPDRYILEKPAGKPVVGLDEGHLRLAEELTLFDGRKEVGKHPCGHDCVIS
jgi:hypothetical protein